MSADEYDEPDDGSATRSPTKTKFTPVDAARVALDLPRVALTPARLRIVLAAATMWCRELQFPTVRELARELGLAGPSSVGRGFGHHVGLHAAVIWLEWRQLDAAADSTSSELRRWFVRHGEDLVAMDRTCLRLPALVWAAVVSADPSMACRHPELAFPLHALAALVDAPGCVSLDDLRRAVSLEMAIGVPA